MQCLTMTTIILLLQMNDMKIKRFIFTLSLLLVVAVLNAQNKDKRFTPERFQAELEQYITRKACLTPQEASLFFPVYREMRRKQRSVHKEMKSLKRIKPVTDADCKKNINRRDEFEIEIKKIQKSYHDKFMQILPAKKVYDVLNAEDKFHRQMFKRTAGKNRRKK